MNRIIILLLVLTCFSMCTNHQKDVQGNNETTLMIYYFHATNRCGNCMAIEENTQKAIEKYFPEELKRGSIRFSSVNLDQDSSKSLVEKCDASAMTLFFVKKDADGTETKTDFSEFAINNARSKPDAYMQGIRERILELYN
jgi:hypothetical protein